MRLTVAQALVRFLSCQFSERDGEQRRLVAGCFGIFGHGNVAGVGQALLEAELRGEDELPYYLARNEQGMVHAAAAYARHTNRLSTLACTTSIGPGATNMVTGAALATINRVPVLLLPGDVFATRIANPVLQELEDPRSLDVSVNDCLRPVSRYFDRVQRPEQLASALLGAMRVLTDPVETGAVTLCLPQDVQAEAYDWPEELFARRVWHVRRPEPEAATLAEAAALLRSARAPLIVAGGGTIYSEATEALRALAEATGVPVAETQAGKGSLPYDHPQSVGAIGATGTTAANALAAEADVVLGVGTRWSDFTTASNTVFAADDVRFVNLNVAPVDAHKTSALALVADARAGLACAGRGTHGLVGRSEHTARASELAAAWDETVTAAYALGHGPLPAQSEVIGAVNRASRPQDVVVCAAGSMPGDLHKLWRTRDPKGYHVEYGFSCMGYEIAGGLGIKLADPGPRGLRDGRRRVVPDAQLRARDGGVGGHQARRRAREQSRLRLDRRAVGVGRLAALRHALSLPQSPDGRARRRAPAGRLRRQCRQPRRRRAGRRRDRRPRGGAAGGTGPERTTVIVVETDPLVGAPDSQAWWDVPIAEVSELESTRAARAAYVGFKARQRAPLAPHDDTRSPR